MLGSTYAPSIVESASQNSSKIWSIPQSLNLQKEWKNGVGLHFESDTMLLVEGLNFDQDSTPEIKKNRSHEASLVSKVLKVRTNSQESQKKLGY